MLFLDKLELTENKTRIKIILFLRNSYYSNRKGKKREGDIIYKVLIAGSIEYNTGLLEALPVWGRNSDFQVSGKVHNGNEALRLLRENNYDMVITEIDIPGLDGVQLLRYVNQEKLCPFVVILSNTVEFRYVRECIIFGAFDYLKKMPDAETMLNVLQRAREQLVSKACQFNENEGEKTSYPILEESRIIQAILKGDSKAVSQFQSVIHGIYMREEKDTIKSDMTIKKLYTNIVSSVFAECRWLSNYVSIEYYKQLDYLWVGSTSAFGEFFVRKLQHLFDLMKKLYLFASDSSLNALLEYILNNPEENLSLKTTAEKVFLNYSYLSNNFSSKLGIRYNEYVVLVRMNRAAFLLQNTDMKIYEISLAVSYHDVNYFTRQFKKLYGMSPSEFRSDSMGDDALDYSFL